MSILDTRFSIFQRQSFYFPQNFTSTFHKLGTKHHKHSIIIASHFQSTSIFKNHKLSNFELQSSYDESYITNSSAADLLEPGRIKEEDQQEQDYSEAIESVPLVSEVDIDYSKLSTLLKEQDFRKADDVTRAVLIELAGEEARARGWVYFTEARSLPLKDMETIDNLWRAASGNKFGYSVQKSIFNQCQKRWPKFFREIDWTVGENNNYRKWPSEFNYSLINVKNGHLPLTNCLRGTQLFEELMNHKAFNKDEDQLSASSSVPSEASKLLE